jgi:hypothetical protein
VPDRMAVVIRIPRLSDIIEELQVFSIFILVGAQCKEFEVALLLLAHQTYDLVQYIRHLFLNLDA